MMDVDTDKPLEGLRGDGGVDQLEREGGEERVTGDTYGRIVPCNYSTLLLLTWSYSYTWGPQVLCSQ